MKKSFMTRVLAVSLSAAMAFSMSSASNLMTASAASTVNLKTTFKTLKVNQTYQLKLTNNTLNWKITKVTTSNKKICTVYNKKASSVMLKGKGVGRAKIKVKVKTTKRKYPKNIKYMTCTANVKAADNPVTPDANAFSATVTPVSLTQVRVTFNKAVDDASDASKFTISDGVKVTKSDPEADKLSTVLTIEGAEAGKSYDLTVKGLAVNGAAQADLNLKFTAPSEQTVDTGYKLIVTPAQSIVKSDGQTQTRVTFEVQKGDKTVTDQTAQIEFSASRGRFADTRATLKDGKVEVMYSAPQETVSVPAVITATVVESSDPKMIGTQGVGNITLSPHPDNLTAEAAIITSAAAGTADRVIAYFDKAVNADEFMKEGRPDKNKFDCKIKTGLDSSFSNNTGEELNVVAILPVPNEPNALEILVSKPMIDNANASITFKDKRTKNNGIDTTNTVNFRLADAREPSVLSVESSGTKQIDITFSEAVLPYDLASDTAYAAQNLNNFLIDGRPLSSWGIDPKKITDPDTPSIKRDPEDAGLSSSEIARTEKKVIENESFDEKDGKVTLHSYTVTDGVGTDERHKVTITVGSGHVLSEGPHMLTVRNVGDWAANTDKARNSVSTQVLPFTVAENSQKPEFTVNVQSPEQFELNFNTEFRVADKADRFTTQDSSEEDGASILQLQENVNGTWTTISNSTSAKTAKGQNPVMISRVGDDEKKYLLEVRRDWTDVYDYENTKQDYYTKQLRLHVDAGKLVNVANNLRNDTIDIYLNADDAKVTNGSTMREPDLTSPKVVGIKQAEAKNGTLLHSWNVELSEPVKISSDANKEGLTPSQKQQEGVNRTSDDKLIKNQGVPVAFARFVNADNPGVVVEGIVEENFFIDAEDKVINVAPVRKLSGGNWRVVVGSISDDYSSTIATDGQVITVDETAVSTDFKVVWAAVATDLDYDEARMGNVPSWNNRGSYIFVKFNKAVDMATALNENNYALNNQPLPHGASIHANIKNYDDHDGVLDSVTIALPRRGTSGYLYNDYTVDTLSTQLSINGVVAAGTGEALSGSGMNQLPYNIGESSNADSGKNDVKINDTKVKKQNDAVWGNHESEQFHPTAEGYINKYEDYYEALRAALDNDQYRKVKIQRDMLSNATLGKETDDAYKAARAVFGKNLVLNINRAVDVDLDGGTFSGNIVVSTTDAVSTMTISNGTINGVSEEVRGNNASLTVNAGVVKHFVLNNVQVNRNKNEYAVVINNVWTDSFETRGATVISNDGVNSNGTIYVNDTDGFGFENQVNWAGRLIINSNGRINLKGGFPDAYILVKQSAELHLGVFDKENGDHQEVDISGATIRIEGPEAKVMITDATLVKNSSKAPKIVAAAKDVKVYSKNSKFGPDSCTVDVTSVFSVDGGNVEEIDENGRKVSAADSKLNTDTINKTPAAMEKAFKAVDILDASHLVEGQKNYELTMSDYVSGSGLISKGIINKEALAESIVNDVVNKVKTADYKLEKEDGSAIKESDITVSFKLSGNAKLFDEDKTDIWPKTADKQVTGSDIITVTLTYNGNTYTRTIKVTK